MAYDARMTLDFLWVRLAFELQERDQNNQAYCLARKTRLSARMPVWICG